jgi:hypothetical protein
VAGKGVEQLAEQRGVVGQIARLERVLASISVTEYFYSVTEK